MPSRNSSKAGAASETASISTTSSLLSEKERAQTKYGSIDVEKQERKPSRTSRLIEYIKSIEPPEPRIPESRHSGHMPGWAH